MGHQDEAVTAVCLVSGGMDSCVAAAIAATECKELYFLHLTYGQRTHERERQAFHALAEHYRAKDTLRVDVSHLKRIGGSALTDESVAVPKGDLDRPGIPATYVPFRNANLLSIAVSWAEVLGATRIYFGAVEEDSSGYPDCRESFVAKFNDVIEAGTKPDTHIDIKTPLIHLTKEDIVKKGVELAAPLHLTWSCYTSNGPRACGRCDSCALRRRGFEQAGVPDPVDYER